MSDALLQSIARLAWAAWPTLRVLTEVLFLSAGSSVDIQGVCKSTVVRGEDDFPIGVLRVTDCHDTVVYALAPLQYVKIAACSDCQVLTLTLCCRPWVLSCTFHRLWAC